MFYLFHPCILALMLVVQLNHGFNVFNLCLALARIVKFGGWNWSVGLDFVEPIWEYVL